jgi:hypothetical protein
VQMNNRISRLTIQENRFSFSSSRIKSCFQQLIDRFNIPITIST